MPAFWVVLWFIRGHHCGSMPYVTPAWIEPEWYFLPFYAVLRAVPHKLGGTVALVLAVMVLALLPLVSPNVPLGRRLVSKALAANGVSLGYVGIHPVTGQHPCGAELGFMCGLLSARWHSLV
jgi:ubiquinol-cytochrome c reductase cytochrome b subunit